MSKESIKTLTSFSGADMVATFGKRAIGELQSITWAVQRKKAPVYTLGSADPRSFSRGIRGVAGSLVFAVFNRDALIEELKKVWSDIAPPAMFTAAGNLALASQDAFGQALTMTAWDQRTTGGEKDVNGNTVARAQDFAKQLGTDEKTQVQVPGGFSVIRKQNIMYADMLPPFDITMTFANEYGQAAFQKIYDVDILNESSGISVDTTVMERQMTYIARRISPLIEGVYNREAKTK